MPVPPLVVKNFGVTVSGALESEGLFKCKMQLRTVEKPVEGLKDLTKALV